MLTHLQNSGSAPSFNGAAFGSVADKFIACSSASACATQTLTLPASTAIDRVMIQEDIAHGQRIRAYHVSAKVGGAWKTIASGQSVGNKRIDLLNATVTTSELKLVVDANQAAPIYLKFFGAFKPCKVEV